MKALAFVAIMGAGTVLTAVGPAKADLMISPHDGIQDLINDAGGTTGTGNPNNQPPQGNGLPLGLTGYNSQNAGPNAQGPSLIAVAPGTYKFTYMGKGDAANHDTFAFAGHTFDNTINAAGDSFSVYLSANTEIDFLYKDLTTGASVVDDANPIPTNISYFLGLDHSSHCNNASAPGTPTCDLLGDALTGPSFEFAYIGLADLPWTPTLDHDFQDLGVRVDEVPEPATLAVFGTALAGFAAIRRRRKAA